VKSWRIAYVAHQPFSLEYGGFEIQTSATLDAVKAAGADAYCFDPWATNPQYDVLHCWGISASHLPLIRRARSNGRKVVLTALLPYYESMYARVRYLASRVLRGARLIRQILPEVDALVVVNERQKCVAMRYCGMPGRKVHIIPNIVPDAFARGTPSDFESTYSYGDFVLTVGNVCRRKNQLLLASAAARAGIPALIIGPVLPGEELYGERLNVHTHPVTPPQPLCNNRCS
jgi:glycosyltransferase involved in cell wall biosynthesis